MLISQTYYKIQRKIINNEQHLIETEETLKLYKDKIISANDKFELSDIHDMSYRSIASTTGLLYLHTIRGVYPFQIKTNPSNFIRMYQKLKAMNGQDPNNI